MAQAFLLSNMTPQIHAFNAGIWEALEDKIRDWVKQYSAIYVVAGPIFNSKADTRFIGNGVAIPDAFFKAVYLG